MHMLHGQMGGVPGGDRAAGGMGPGIRGQEALGQLLMLFQIIIIVALVFDQRPAGQVEDPGRSAVDEPAVVGDAQDGACVSADSVLQDLLGEDVQVVRGLVQDQEISFREHQLGKGQTPALTAGQIRYELEDVVSGEQECGQRIPDLGIVERRIGVLQFIEQGLVRVQDLVFLIVVADVYLGAKAHRT